jgi:hypothetical protein
MINKPKYDNKTLLQIALVAGIVILAFNNMDGWGWLIFILICTLA